MSETPTPETSTDYEVLPEYTTNDVVIWEATGLAASQVLITGPGVENHESRTIYNGIVLYANDRLASGSLFGDEIKGRVAVYSDEETAKKKAAFLAQLFAGRNK